MSEEAVTWLRRQITSELGAVRSGVPTRAEPAQHIIADLESKLAILDLHIPANPAEDYDHPDWLECAECGPNSPGGNFMAAPGDGDTWWPCQTIHLLASGYRYRLGYAEHWGNGG